MNPFNIKSVFVLSIFLLLFSVFTYAQDGNDYNSVIKSADEYYQEKDYYNAKAAYQLASKLNPDEVYPKEKIQEIIDLLKAEMAVRGEYDEYIETADGAFDVKDYEKAIEFYEKALGLIAYEEHPNKRLEESRQLLEAAQLKQSLYKETIKTADEYFANQEYEQALSFYRDAANVDENQKYPNDQILIITNLLKTQAQNQQAYKNAILQADQQLNYQKFSEALKQYEMALQAKPGDDYAINQVAKMKKFIELEKQYDQITEKADELYVAQDLQAAKAEYQKAMEILPEKTYALNMISKIDANLNEALAKKQKLEENYQKAIADGDELFRDEKYQSAYSKYAKALELKPNEEYPKRQLEEIDIILATGYVEISCYVFEDNKGLFDSRIQLTEGNRVLETAEIGTNGRHKFKLDLNKEYVLKFYKDDYVRKIFDINTALPRDVNHNNIYTYELPVELFPICSTDLSILDQPLAEIKYYADKGNFYFDEQRAQIIINKVNALKEECEEIREKEAKQEDYNKLIADADKRFEQKKYSEAIENYSAASVILPNKEYPKQKISEINQILEATDKYQALIISGDAKYNAKDYENALYDYYAAKNIKPKEAYPQQKIEEIDAMLNAQKALNARYEAQLKQADSLLGLDSLMMAKSAYQLALNIKKDESYPQSQIEAIDQRLQKLDEINERYKDAIANADKLFEKENLNDARAAYLVASQIKPDEMYPKYKIEDINTIEEQRRLRALNNNYKELIAQADAEFENKIYKAALELYKRAGEIKPDEEYPPAQIKIINSLVSELAANEQKYDRLIAQADQEFEAKTYAPSFDNYKTALAIKPNEEYPRQRMAEIEEIMKELADLELAYQEAVRQGDAQFEQKNWTSSLKFYQQAAELKPEETYPPQKIAEINEILNNLANQDAAYEDAIAQGDQQFEAEDWNNSKISYETALRIKANEQYPKDQITLIDQKLEELAQLQLQYDALITEADQLFAAQQLIDSKAKFQEAARLKPNEAYPPQKIAEIDGLLKAMADKDAAYAAAIEEADLYFGELDWNRALTAYQNASDIKPGEQYPKDQIEVINGKLKEIADRQAQYNALIAEADQLFNSQAYVDSKGKYQEAITIMADEQYPKDKIAEINNILKQLADQEALYEELIASGDAQFLEKSYNPALSSYQQASEIKPEEQYPKDKISEIENILRQQAEQDRMYSETIQLADQNRDQENWEMALGKYQEASGIKPEEQYPKDQIALINQKLQELADQQAAYNAAIAKADIEFETQQWQASLHSYQNALEIKPDEVYPQTQIQEINKILKEIADTEAAYQQAIAEADAFFKTEEWRSALTKYELAASLKPEEQYPQDKIADLKAILGELAAQQAQYDALIEEADQFFTNENYPSAISSYQLALEIKPNEAYPQLQLTKIEEILARLAKIQKQYDDLIKEGDKHFVKEEWTLALPAYQQAAVLKAEEVYPKEQINIINEKLQAIADRKEQYEILVAEADQLYQTKEYETSISKYEAALAILPDKQYPKDQIKTIRDLLEELAEKNAEYEKIIAQADDLLLQESFDKSKEQYQEAISIFTNRPYPKEQIAKIDVLIEKHAQYKAFVEAGDEQFKNKEYEAALISFKEAQTVLPDKTYPPQKIAEIGQILEMIAMTRAAYDAAIQKADALLAEEEYEPAKLAYQEALDQLSTEVYPRQKIMEIDQILSDLARKRVQFDKIIAQANKAFDEQSYDVSLGKYKEALGIFPEEEYPQERIEEINGILAQMANQKERYESLVAQGDHAFEGEDYKTSIQMFRQAQAIYPNESYPPQKIAEAEAALAKIQRELDVAYQRAIDAGDRSFRKKDWDLAKESYYQASEIKPEELYPKEKLAEINKILEQELLAQQKEYDRYIADGERFYSTKYYQEAILSFEKALGVFPFEKYPAEMIDKIFEMIKKNSMLTLLDGKMTLSKNKEEKFKFDPIAFKDRSENYILLEVKRLNPDEQVKLFVNFGKGGSQNGGYSIPLESRDGYHSYFVSIGKQVRWVNQDNDYISLLPEGGDVEVKLIKLSRNGI